SLYYERGAALLELGKYDRALADDNEALRRNPDYPPALNSRCWAKAVQGNDLNGALADCNAALHLRPESAATLDSLGFVYLRMSRFTDAIAQYTAAIERNSKLAPSFFGRGVAKLRSGDKAGGNADIVQAEALDPGVAKQFALYGVTP